MSEYGGLEFNPCQVEPTRFAPIRDLGGICIPSLYAGSTLDSAIFETVFHDIGTSNQNIVPIQDVKRYNHLLFENKRILIFAELRAPDLLKWGIDLQQLVASPPKYFQLTAKWAEAIHNQFETVDGLVWTSNKCDPDSAYLFFGDRIDESDLTTIVSRNGASDVAFLSDVRNAGIRAGIKLSMDR